ncbi:MAG: succinate dehydrogenase/fumarate reductase iron-sulfur subunit [Anaerolineae bacterium]|nr:succinate dehydrogenase/fumarate reductase iron-sulfur subunit [Anaerolineae bacterium]
MAEQIIEFKVQRYKQGQPAPTYQTFKTLCDDNTTVLVALQDIRRDQDGSLVLRHSCHHASCGTCGMRVNGKEELGCVVKVLDLGTSTVTVEPMRNMPIISDLVVNMEPFYDRYNAVGMPYVRQSEYLDEADLAEGLEAYQRYENCIECNLCVSGCPIMGSDELYLGPATLAAARRVIEEPRGVPTKPLLDWVDSENGCWRCHVAYECNTACPSEVYPGDQIMALRRDLTKRKFRGLFGRGGKG